MHYQDDKHTMERIEQKMTQVILSTTHQYTTDLYFKEKLRKKLHEQLISFKKNSSLVVPPSVHKIYDIQNIDIKTECGFEEIHAKLIFNYLKKPDFTLYGGPGYEGELPWQICEYPEHHGVHYRWNPNICKWEFIDIATIGPKSKQAEYQNEGFFHKLMTNAAFEPFWGTQGMSGEVFDGGRRANGQKMWGHASKPSATWNKVDFKNMFQAIYNISLNIKEILGFKDQLSKLKQETNEKLVEQNIIDTITKGKRIKVPLRIRKVNHWSYFMNNGHVDQSGSETIKDTLIYPNDEQKVLKHIEAINSDKKSKALDKFKNKWK